MAALGPRRVEERGLFRRVLDPADELIYEEIHGHRDAPDLAERDDVLSLLLQARHEDGSAMTDVGAARRVDDTAGGRARDDCLLARVGGRAAGAASGQARAAARRRGRVHRRRLQGDASPAADPRSGDQAADRADGDRRPPAAGRRERGAVHLPRAPARGRLPRAARVPARALPRAAGRHLHVDPVRRGRAALPRRQFRAVRDEGRAAGVVAAGAPPERSAPRADHTTSNNAGARPRRHRRRRAAAPSGRE